MPSALETLVKILKLEQNTGYQDKAVIGGLDSFALKWESDAHAQAKKPEHHALVDELVGLLHDYKTTTSDGRHDAIKYMLGRITGRIPPRGTPATPPIEASPRETTLPDQPPPPELRRPVRETRDEKRDETRYERPARREDRPPRPERPPKTVEDDDSAPLFAERPSVERSPSRAERDSAPEREAEVEQATDNRIETGYQPSLDDLVLEPIFTQPPEPFDIRPPRIKTRPPRRRRDHRNLEQQAEVLRAIKRPVSELHGIGPKMAEKLVTLEITTIEGLLYTFPRRYDDYTTMRPLNRLRPGELVSAAGTIRSVAMIKGKRNIEVFNVVIDDGVGVLTASFFNQSYLRGKLDRGMQVVFSGKTDLYLGKLCMTNPHWEFIEQDALTTRAIVPIYPLTASLSAANMRKASDAALTLWADELPDSMPASVLDRTGLAELSWSVRQMHRPESMEMLEHARERLAFDDLMLLQLGVLRNRHAWQAVPADPLPVTEDWLNSFTATLPYPLTGAQIRAIEAIRIDIAQPIPMNRLLQGDVGSGKTVVAAAALAMAVANGHQAAIMAPTGILAEQHYRNLARLFANLPGGDAINVKLLTGATSAQERAEILWGLGEGSVHVVIGTHALIQEDVNFWRLGLAVIDEQHRFGVEQRGRLRGKGVNPHVLVMTATPIPRTLALTMYADLDLTIIDEMPPGRTPIDTRVLFGKERERAYSFIRAQLEKGRQAFIVYPLVEASDSEAMAEVRSAVEEYERLQREVFPDYQLGLLHGRLSAAEKDQVMAAFSQGDLHILISTSVVEVGIDVPNASVMLIEGANRFGLAQLHQFRGRVGRGQHPSFCLLIADAADEPDNPRLKAMEETSDGFKLAEIDWQLRGAGELLGTRQSGGVSHLVEYMTPHLVEMAQQEARALYVEDPPLTFMEHALLRQRLTLIYGEEPGAEVS